LGYPGPQYHDLPPKISAIDRVMVQKIKLTILNDLLQRFKVLEGLWVQLRELGEHNIEDVQCHPNTSKTVVGLHAPQGTLIKTLELRELRTCCQLTRRRIGHHLRSSDTRRSPSYRE